MFQLANVILQKELCLELKDFSGVEWLEYKPFIQDHQDKVQNFKNILGSNLQERHSIIKWLCIGNDKLSAVKSGQTNIFTITNFNGKRLFNSFQT